MRFSKKVAGRGNLTVPTDIRHAMDIDEGDIVEFEIVGIVRKGTGRMNATDIATDSIGATD